MACFKAYVHQARKDSNPNTIPFYFILLCLTCKTECFTAKGYAKNKRSNTGPFKKAKYANNILLTTFLQNIDNSKAKIVSRLLREVKNNLTVLA